MMAYKKLYILVEGDDDLRFIDTIFKEIFNSKFDRVDILKYANETKKWKKQILRSIKMAGDEYIIFGDMDSATCITKRKTTIKNKFYESDTSNIIIIIKEIEGWYLAGIDNKILRKFKIKDYRDTNSITKETFSAVIPLKYESRIDFMIEILKDYSIDIGIRKNASLKYFSDKYLKRFVSAKP